jgi:hypothetical protein
MKESLEGKSWWSYLEEDLQELILQTQLLIKTVEEWRRNPSTSPSTPISGPKGSRQEFHDYAFVVFPAAKAYEGFLKKLFLDLGLISPEQFYGKRFRVGKALNPSLKKSLREKFGVYYKIITYCGGDSGLADTLWDTWRECRNILFHWFPNEKNAISFEEAKEKFDMILAALDKATKECKIG